MLSEDTETLFQRYWQLLLMAEGAQYLGIFARVSITLPSGKVWRDN
jgi:hypothetical protein